MKKKRTFELLACGNAAAYSVVLKIDGRAFGTMAETVNGDTVGDAYREFARKLEEAYSDLDTNLEYTDIRNARDQVYAVICALNKICKGGAE